MIKHIKLFKTKKLEEEIPLGWLQPIGLNRSASHFNGAV